MIGNIGQERSWASTCRCHNTVCRYTERVVRRCRMYQMASVERRISSFSDGNVLTQANCHALTSGSPHCKHNQHRKVCTLPTTTTGLSCHIVHPCLMNASKFVRPTFVTCKCGVRAHMLVRIYNECIVMNSGQWTLPTGHL